MLNQLEPEDKHWLNIISILANVVLSNAQNGKMLKALIWDYEKLKKVSISFFS